MMKKLLILLTLAVALCLCLVGCGEDDEKSTSSIDGSTNGTIIEADLSDILGGLASGGLELPEDEF